MITPKDTDLREALRRKYANVPKMKSSLPLTPSKGRGTQSRFSSLSPWRGRLGSLEEPLNVALAPQRGANPHSRRRSGVRLVGAIAASILLLLVFHFTQKPVEEQPIVAEVVEQNNPQPAVSEPIIEEKKEEALPEVQPTPQPVKKHRKSVKKQNTPIEEPLLAEAEPTLKQAMPMPEQAEDPIAKAAHIRQELRQRGEQVEQYVAMLNERVKSEHHYVQF